MFIEAEEEPDFEKMMITTDIPKREIKESSVEPVEPLKVTLHTIIGEPALRTIQIEGIIKQTKLQVLVDSRANLNFMNRCWDGQLKLPVDLTPRFHVLVRDDNVMECCGVCRKVPITLGSTTFDINLHVVPFHEADLILGVTWLQQLGRVIFDYSRRSQPLERSKHRKPSPAPPSQSVSLAELRWEINNQNRNELFYLRTRPIIEEVDSSKGP